MIGMQEHASDSLAVRCRVSQHICLVVGIKSGPAILRASSGCGYDVAISHIISREVFTSWKHRFLYSFHIMLVRNFATLFCSGVLAASALKLATLEDLYDSAGESTFELSNAQQVPFRPLSQDHALEHDVENDMVQISQKAEDKTIYQVLSDNPK
jgi:hypothetical protein